MNTMNTDTSDKVKDYYGKLADIGTCGCSCSPRTDEVMEELNSHEFGEEVFSLGCGLGGVDEAKPGETVVDIGSGAGLDVFKVAEKVGPTGSVIGLDFTPEMIAKAKQNAENLKIENVSFLLGSAEDMPLEDESIDFAVSNCVINLSEDKAKVFSELYRILKPGGRFTVQDMLTRSEIPDEIRDNELLWSSCVGGAVTIDEYSKHIQDAGFGNLVVDITHSETFKGIDLVSAKISARK